MSVKEQLRALIVENPNVQLKPGEICVFQAKAKLGTPHEELVVTTKTKPGLGVGIRLTEHFGIGIGRQKATSKTEKHTVWNHEPCEFFMLEERMLLKFKNRNIVIDYEDISNLKLNKDALTVTARSNDYCIFMANKDVKRFNQMYMLLGEANKEGIELKDLKDDGIEIEYEVKSNSKYEDSYPQTIFLWCVGRKATPVMKRDKYPQYLFYECNIQNAPKYHRDMIQEGYLEVAPIEDILATLKLVELKDILKKHELGTTGKKDSLIASIVENVPSEELAAMFPEKKYVLSEKGKTFLEDHSDYVKLKQHSNWQISAAEFDAAKRNGRSFYDVCWGIFNSRIAKGANLYEHRNIYYSMYTLLKEEGRMKNAMEMLIRVLYYDANSLSSGYMSSYLQGFIGKKEFLNNAAQNVFFAPGIIKDIGDMEEFFSEEMINKLYGNKNTLQPCSKQLFSDIVHAIIDGNFDEDYYKKRIAEDYRKA